MKNRFARWVLIFVLLLTGCTSASVSPEPATVTPDIMPHKELIWFERSGHNPWVAESALFVDVVVNKVFEETYALKK